MDDPSCNDLDSGLHRHQFQFLTVLLVTQIHTQHLTGAIELSRHRQRHGEGFRLVLWHRAHAPSPFSRFVHGCHHGILRVWPPVAPPHRSLRFALFSGNFYSFTYTFFFLSVRFNLFIHLFNYYLFLTSLNSNWWLAGYW